MNLRTFEFHRDADVSGVSGTGVVADGVTFDDGVTVVRWRGERRSTVVWPSVEDAIAVHGHDGATRLVYTDLSAVAVAMEKFAEGVAAMLPEWPAPGPDELAVDALAMHEQQAELVGLAAAVDPVELAAAKVGEVAQLVDELLDEHAVESAAIVRAEFDDEDGARL